MTPQQAIDFFGGRGRLAAALGVTDTAVGQWVRQGWIYYDRQCQIQVESERLPAEERVGKRRLVASQEDILEDKRRVAGRRSSLPACAPSPLASAGPSSGPLLLAPWCWLRGRS